MTVPVHDSLRVLEATDLYQNDEWWKSVVTYQFDGSDSQETAMYLWHRDDDGWTRKNKYVIKTVEAWTTDSEIIDRYIREDPPETETTEFPVSDYYTTAVGETVFQSDGWWKAIVNIVEKGSYETDEVMVYVWQEVDDDWRRRQKYTIKRVSDWEEEREIVEKHLTLDEPSVATEGTSEPTETASRTSETTETVSQTSEHGGGVSEEISTLGDEIDAHLSEEFGRSGET